MRIVKKILLYTGLGLLVIVISLALSVFLFKDKIIRNFIEAVNKDLNTKVKVEKFDVSAFRKFPQLSIVLTGVYVEDSHEGQYPLLTADKISFQLNPIEVYQGSYNIKGLEIENSETNLKINRKGENNYTITKESGDGSGSGEVGFALKNIHLKNALVRYADQQSDEDLIFHTEKLAASIQSSGNVYRIEAAGELTTQKIRIERTSVFEGKTFGITAQVTYDDDNDFLTIEPSFLILKGSAFSVKGTYDWRKTTMIDLNVEGKDTNIQTILSLLPETASQQLTRYQSSGETYFSASLKGPITKTKNPALSVEFGLRDATIFHPDTKARIEHANLEGSFASSNLADLHQASLILKNIEGVLNKENFQASLVVHDFLDSEVILKFKGKLDAASLLGLYPVQALREISGSLLTDFSFEGKLSWLRDRNTAQKAATQGTIELQDLNFLYGESKLPVKDLKGSLQFSNNDLALSNVSLKAGNSDFMINGFFKNIITFLLFENQPIGIEADVRSNFIDADQLFDIGFTSKKSNTDDYHFTISKNLNLNFNCAVQGLRYQRFSAHQLKGDLLVKDEVAVSRNVKLKTMGGDLSFSAIVDAKNHKAIDVLTSAKLKGIHIDSVFYVFRNFDQDFIEDKHLKGQATADVSVEMTLNEKLKLFQETLIADIGMTIKNGELNNFEPLKSLNKYLDDEGLSKLRFADLKNDIHIEKKTIYIPQMQVRSNVTAIQISGTHTFDQHIDYRLITPLRNKKKIDVTEAASALEEDNGQLKLFLKITGTTDNYRVQYDTEAFRKKLAGELKKEVQELKDAFKTKGKQKKKELELEKDEYFDW